MQQIPYVEKMLAGGFKEATENRACFPDDDIETFENLMQWVYSGSLPPFQWVQDIEGESGEFESSWCIGQAYLLLDKLCLFSLADQALTDFITATARMSIVLDYGLIKFSLRYGLGGFTFAKACFAHFPFCDERADTS